ncbi:hypothetical protein JIN85_02350 [Luteolibacter pohnpeiensis]|uniref:Uncharacterized protein n=1 Tax=Luteolibacter pohnpeiensis TaxID=454153 RepID=A0A934S5P8_9BACT|nr:hypothetical protein [Luteolibacter pohnpeiensis]MBK1881236.1 hypothetical protein [Luteolibacter pohnpeiensis]
MKKFSFMLFGFAVFSMMWCFMVLLNMDPKELWAVPIGIAFLVLFGIAATMAFALKALEKSIIEMKVIPKDATTNQDAPNA